MQAARRPSAPRASSRWPSTVARTLLGVQIVVDALWRWKYTKSSVRSSIVRSIARWAHRHGF